MNIEPIGIFRCAAKYPYDAPRQAVLAENSGVVELLPAAHDVAFYVGGPIIHALLID